MRILSNWRLTFDPAGTPLVLVDIGQLMDGEIIIPWRQQAETRGRIRAAAAMRVARGNAESGITLTTYTDHASDAAARLFCLQRNIAMAGYSGRTATLRLEIAGSALVYQMAAATLDVAETELVVAPVARTMTRWSVGGTAWTQVV